MIRGMIQFVLFFVVKLLKTSITFFIDQRSALALFVTRITRTDDPDLAVTFDDLAEFTSALHRRSNFHFSTPKNLMVLFKNNSFILFALRRLLPAPAAVFIRCFGSFFAMHFSKHDTRNVHLPLPGNLHSPELVCDAIQTKLDAIHCTA